MTEADFNYSSKETRLSAGLDRYSLVVAINDVHLPVLRSTLLKSPDVQSRCQVIVKNGFPSASAAYNEAIVEASEEIVVFVHADLYLPEGWFDSLGKAIRDLNQSDPNWAVLGVAGISNTGEFAGHIYSTGLGHVVGSAFRGRFETVSVDEVVIVIRRSSGLRFDDRLSGFHLHGTDICLEGRRRGMKSYVISAFCVHNSNGIQNLPASFWSAYLYLRTKWWRELPVRTCCTTLSKSAWPLLQALKSRLMRLAHPTQVGKRCADPEALYRSLVSSNC